MQKNQNNSTHRSVGRPPIYKSSDDSIEANRRRSRESFRERQLSSGSAKYKEMIKTYDENKLRYQQKLLSMKLELIEEELSGRC